jgi:hypothetical protein
VRDEAGRAKERGVLIPVRLDDCEIPLGFNAPHTLDLSNWSGSPSDKLLAPLVEAISGKASASREALPGEPSYAANAAVEEAREWRAVVEKTKPSEEDFRHYLASHGDAAVFAELARLQIAKLKKEQDEAAKGPGVHARIAIAGAVVALVGGVLAIVLNITAIQEKFGQDSLSPSDLDAIVVHQDFRNTGKKAENGSPLVEITYTVDVDAKKTSRKKPEIMQRIDKVVYEPNPNWLPTRTVDTVWNDFRYQATVWGSLSIKVHIFVSRPATILDYEGTMLLKQTTDLRRVQR